MAHSGARADAFVRSNMRRSLSAVVLQFEIELPQENFSMRRCNDCFNERIPVRLAVVREMEGGAQDCRGEGWQNAQSCLTSHFG